MKRTVLFLSILLVTALLTGCSSEKPVVCTTTYPVSFLVERIAQDRVTLCQLSEGPVIQRATMNEDFDEMLQKMDLILSLGLLEPYMEMYRSDIRSARVDLIDLSAQSSIYDFKRFTTIMVSNSEVILESPYYEGIVFDTIDTYEKDPVVWMDAVAMTSMARIIKDWLVDKFPEDAKFYEDNYASLESELARLDAEYQIMKLRRMDIKFVSITPSFGNWQKAYGVSVYPIILSRYGVVPSGPQMEIIKQRIIDDGVKYIAFEPNLSDELRELYNDIKEELELTQINLHNLHTLTENDLEGNKNYISIMYENLSILEAIAE